MPRVSPIQENFSAGEISKSIQSRVSTDIYRKGLKRARNWMPTVQGPIRLRDGSQFLEQVAASNWVSGDTSSLGVKVFTFQRGLDNDVIVEVGTTDIVLRDSVTGEQITGGVTANLIPDPNYEQGLTQWGFDPTVFLFGTHPGDPVIFGPWTTLPGGQRHVDISGFLEDAPQGFIGGEFTSGPAGIDIPLGSETLVANLTINWVFGCSVGNWLLFGGTFPLPFTITDIQFRVRVGTSLATLGDILDSNFPITAPATTLQEIINFVPGPGNNKIFMGISLNWVGPGAIPSGLLPDSMGINSYAHSLTVPLPGGSGSLVEFVSPYNASHLDCLNTDMDPGEQVMVFTHHDVETHRLRLFNGEWTFEAISAITDPEPFVAPVPNPWAAGNYPRACAYHEGRLYLAGTVVEPSTIWASESGNYQNFNGSIPTTKADPLLFPLSSAGKIQTLTSRKSLVILTDVSEVIGTSVDGVIAFDDFSFPKQTDWGSNCVDPIRVGRDMLFTSPSKKIVRTFSDKGDSVNSWDGDEISLVAEDIFSSAVRQMVYVDEPAYQAAFLLSDGTLGMATYFYPQEVVGWWRYTPAYNDSLAQPTNKIMSITAVNTSEGAKLWMVINRVGFSGTQRPFHEVVGFKQGSKVAMDAFAVRIVGIADGVISDIDHLTDQDVDIVIETIEPTTGVVSYTVHNRSVAIVAGASQPLDTWAWGGTAYVGHFYDNDFQLLSLEGVSNRGTSQTSKRRWNKVFLRLNDSAIPLVEGIPTKDRTPGTPMGRGEPFMTGDVEIVDLGSGEGDIIVTQDKPLITEVTGIFGKVAGREI